MRNSRGDVAVLSDLPTLATTDQMGEIVWEFFGPAGDSRSIRHEPRMTCVDFLALRDAAVAGLGVALLPDHACRGELVDGSLVHVFPQWRTEDGIVHLIFTHSTHSTGESRHPPSCPLPTQAS
jgi:DNA-binding transcriptional LysR family regulator